jgi:prepilin-type N-terminal cleavage/methylation domain-containing protein/prepilin-type processing-associated H-X9-DG protein
MKRQKAFTLIELLVVIAVIAVLMGIIMPALNKAKNLAQGIKCKGNLKNYAIAVAMYTEDHDGKFSDPGQCYFSQTERYPVESGVAGTHLHLRWCNGDLNLRDYPQYGGQMFPYIADASSFICPTFKRLTHTASDDQFFRANGDSIRNYDPWYNYTQNAFIGSPSGSVTDNVVKNINNIKRAAETFSFTEESSMVDTAFNASGLNDTFMIPGNNSMVAGWMASKQNSPWLIEPGPAENGGMGGVGQFYDVVAGFHNAPSGNPLAGKGNCAFLDGHVDAVPRLKTFYYAYPKKN